MSSSMLPTINFRGVPYSLETNSSGDEFYTIDGSEYTPIHSQEEYRKYFEEIKNPKEISEELKNTSDYGKFKHINKKQFGTEDYFLFDFEIDLSNIFNVSDEGDFLLRLSNCIFLQNIKLSLPFSQLGVPNDSWISHQDKKIPDMAFWNVKFEKECLIEVDNILENLSFIFNQCHFSSKLKIRNSESRAVLNDYQNLQKTKLQLKNLHITDCTTSDNNYLRIGFVDVKDFVLSNLRNPPNTEINIGDCHFENFQLTNFRNMGKFRLYKINSLNIEHNYYQSPSPFKRNKTKGSKKFQIDNTSIGKTDFQSVYLSSFEEIKMFDNIFTEMDYTNVVWGDKNIQVGQCNGDTTKKLEKQQDTYRTLKNVASRNNDQPQAIKFFVKEMNYHQKIVSGNKEYLLSDRATLWFNKYTNNFGLSFWKPLGLLFFLSVVLYVFLLFSFDDGCDSKYWIGIFDFLNPTHKTKFINAHHWSGWSYLWDFLFRIVEGLLIYQTIQAFRKYSRKL